ncbi:MAG: hypothetical protein IJX55_08420 [Clostridia bacterium]|nr:hypothetical protein [Clostridia bacterium]
MVTKIVKGCPPEIIKKRKDRIREALNITFEDANCPVKFVVDTLPDGTEVYFHKPGKEYFRTTPNLNDMSPNVGELFTKFSFADIWELLCKLRNAISLENYKKLSVILYRVAYLLDFDYVDGRVRFCPSKELTEEIQTIQNEIDSKGLNINILAFIHFIDILGWNDEMKTHATNEGLNFVTKKPRMGRINTILSCLSIPILLQEFVDEVIKNKDNKANIDFSIAINIAQTFARTRGVHPLPNKRLIELLSPELTE